MERRWMGLPDSLDIISMWSGFPEKDSPGYKEMRFVQEVKGTKIVRVSFTDDIFSIMRSKTLRLPILITKIKKN